MVILWKSELYVLVDAGFSSVRPRLMIEVSEVGVASQLLRR